MKINLKKDSLNDKLKKIWRPFNPPIKVVEQGNDYLILRRSEENSLLIVYSFLISLVITPIVNFILASSLHDIINFNLANSLHDIINFNLANSLHDIINFNLPSSLYDTIFQNIHILFILTHVEVIIFAYLLFYF